MILIKEKLVKNKMELPIELKSELESRININELKELSENTKKIFLKNIEKDSGNSKRLLTTDKEASAYSLFRMPATYGAVSKALEYTFNLKMLMKFILY